MSKSIGIFVGRCQPLHLGHKQIIDKMIEDCGIENSLVILGSTNEHNTANNPFTFEQRIEMIKKVWPDILVTGIDDEDKDNEWLLEFRMLLDLVYIHETEDLDFTLYCGEDSYVAKLFTDIGEIKEVLDRKELQISGTEIRLEMLQPRKMSMLLGWVPLQIYKGLQEMFDEQLNERIRREMV